MHLRLIASLLLIGLAVVFILQNTAVVEIRFIFWSLSMSRALFIFILLATGILSGWLLNSYVRHCRNL